MRQQSSAIPQTDPDVGLLRIPGAQTHLETDTTPRPTTPATQDCWWPRWGQKPDSV